MRALASSDALWIRAAIRADVDWTALHDPTAPNTLHTKLGCQLLTFEANNEIQLVLMTEDADAGNSSRPTERVKIKLAEHWSSRTSSSQRHIPCRCWRPDWRSSPCTDVTTVVAEVLATHSAAASELR